MARREPGNFWVAIALADSHLERPTPDFNEASRLAAAAVALRPESLASHVVAVRSMPLESGQLTDNQLSRLHHHTSEIRTRLPDSELKFLLSEATWLFHIANADARRDDFVAAYKKCLAG